MDNLIYLIVLIAWVVFALYRKSQKKSGTAGGAQQRPPDGGGGMPFPTLEEIFREEEPLPVPAAESVQGQLTTDGESPVLKETAFELEYNRRGIRSIEEMDSSFSASAGQEVIQQGEINGSGDPSEEERKAWVDLRQAVIYSEILNRPYV